MKFTVHRTTSSLFSLWKFTTIVKQRGERQICRRENRERCTTHSSYLLSTEWRCVTCQLISDCTLPQRETAGLGTLSFFTHVRHINNESRKRESYGPCVLLKPNLTYSLILMLYSHFDNTSFKIWKILLTYAYRHQIMVLVI